MDPEGLLREEKVEVTARDLLWYRTNGKKWEKMGDMQTYTTTKMDTRKVLSPRQVVVFSCCF